ncbi:hypothetical protein LT980_25325 (plasmid) [Citrobacter portucalensis]|uniref:hypothetical protein n=1 Tax=Citrobacter portucalensis TaxID=1639133 RepID=UPI00202CD540|nr:hypothetical protein [Citrobacter portucalensis]URR15685.1 hypothetical protein LT980_25325 [Citrobacter portucalensis]
MKVTNKLKLLALGLCMAGTAIAAPDVLNDDAKLKNLEKVCPDCKMVAKDGKRRLSTVWSRIQDPVT